jgi:AhpD family alkylhydroperoxidase
MDDFKKLVEEIHQNLREFSEKTPEQMESFMKLFESIEKDSILDKKTKELISIACSILAKCKYCIAFHVKNALELGASEKEILESAWVAVLMGGGPALMYAQLVLKALKDFS